MSRLLILLVVASCSSIEVPTLKIGTPRLYIFKDETKSRACFSQEDVISIRKFMINKCSDK